MRRAAACLGDERGQVLVVTGTVLIGLLALWVLVTNVGAWFGNDRILQRGADAAALAGARQLALTADAGAATAAASSNAHSNDLALAPGSPRADAAAGWVKVTAIKSKTELPQTLVPDSAQHDRLANAEAAVFGVIQAGAAIPLAVNMNDVEIDATKKLTFDKENNGFGPGNFGAVDICNAGPGHVDDCVPDLDCEAQQNCPVTVLGEYGSPGAGKIKQVIDAVLDEGWLDHDVLLPVYDPDQSGGSGSNMHYLIIGFAVFHLTDAKASPTKGFIEGTFVRMIPVSAVGDPSQTNYGASAVYLVEYEP